MLVALLHSLSISESDDPGSCHHGVGGGKCCGGGDADFFPESVRSQRSVSERDYQILIIARP